MIPFFLFAVKTDGRIVCAFPRSSLRCSTVIRSLVGVHKDRMCHMRRYIHKDECTLLLG